MKKILFTLSIFSAFYCHAQKEAWHWYFGTNAGLDFSAGAPVADINGAMVTDEGCASISNSSGQLQFYTDGTNVWNSNHAPMPNGFNLSGSSTSSQSAMIVNRPGSLTEYYIFTTDGYGGPKGLCYSTVDMTLQGGLGDVVVKNTQLFTPCTERLTATRHANGMDIWIMAHEVGSNNYRAYLLTSGGVSAPVITAIGSVPTIIQGSMKFSPNGTRLASPFQGQAFFELMDFDKTTGVLTNVMQLGNAAWLDPFSVEFSPSGRYLYGVYDPSGTGVLLQFDLSLGTAAAITASAVTVGNYNAGYFGSLQLGPDGKLYAGEQFNGYVGVVNDPEAAGLACNFVVNGVFLGGMTSNYGLPNFLTSFFDVQTPPVAVFSAPNHICPGTCTDFTNLSVNATSYLWTFAGATPSTSVDMNPTNICYNSPGQYTVTLIATNANGSDTLQLNNFITVYPQPAPQGITQSGDTLFAIAGATSYQWYYNGGIVNGATDYFYVAQASGDYNVVATDENGCEVEAVIFSVIASVFEEGSATEINISPNPAGDKLTISHASGIANVKSVTVFNLIGKKVLEHHSSFAPGSSLAEIDVHGLSTGIYWLEVSCSDKVFRNKFMKE
jgi:PKD repeat protein